MCQICERSVLAGWWAEERRIIARLVQEAETADERKALAKAELDFLQTLHDLRLARMRQQTKAFQSQTQLLRAQLAQLANTPRPQLPPPRRT